MLGVRASGPFANTTRNQLSIENVTKPLSSEARSRLKMNLAPWEEELVEEDLGKKARSWSSPKCWWRRIRRGLAKCKNVKMTGLGIKIISTTKTKGIIHSIEAKHPPTTTTLSFHRSVKLWIHTPSLCIPNQRKTIRQVRTGKRRLMKRWISRRKCSGRSYNSFSLRAKRRPLVEILAPSHKKIS